MPPLQVQYVVGKPQEHHAADREQAADELDELQSGPSAGAGGQSNMTSMISGGAIQGLVRCQREETRACLMG